MVFLLWYFLIGLSIRYFGSIGKLPPAKTAAAAASAAAGGASVKRRSADEQEVKRAVEDLVKPEAKDKGVEKKESAGEQAHVRRKRGADQPIVNVETATEETGVEHCLLNPAQRYKPLELIDDSAFATIGRISNMYEYMYTYILIFYNTVHGVHLLFQRRRRSSRTRTRWCGSRATFAGPHAGTSTSQ